MGGLRPWEKIVLNVYVIYNVAVVTAFNVKLWTVHVGLLLDTKFWPGRLSKSRAV